MTKKNFGLYAKVLNSLVLNVSISTSVPTKQIIALVASNVSTHSDLLNAIGVMGSYWWR